MWVAMNLEKAVRDKQDNGDEQQQDFADLEMLQQHSDDIGDEHWMNIWPK